MDCAGTFTVSGAVVMALLLSHLNARSRWSVILVLTELLQWQLPDRDLEARLSGWSKISDVCEGLSRRKLSVSTPTEAMHVGVVTLLRAPLWVPFPRYGSG